MPQHEHTYGWIRQIPDRNDLHYSAPSPVPVAMPSFRDLSQYGPPIFDQRKEGSCTANMGARLAYHAAVLSGTRAVFVPSRDGLYAQTLKLEDNFGWDAGASIRSTLKAIAKVGVWPEDQPGALANQPYNENGYRTEPSEESLAYGLQHQGLVYRDVQQKLDQIQAAIFYGFPVGFGMSICESFETDEVARTGIVPIPKRGEKVLGGHALTIEGYADIGYRWVPPRHFFGPNSWEDAWGDHGFFAISYEHLLNPEHCSDFWVLQSIEVSDNA